MLAATDLAEWWEEQRRISTEWANRGLDEFVDKHPGTVSVVLATTATTVFQFPMVVGSGVVDTLNLGQGVAEGGWGYLKDGLRFLSVVGPLAGGARTVLSRVVALSDANLPNCTWMSAVKALRETGTRHFAIVDDLAKAAGLSGRAETGGAFVHELVGVLQKLGARVRLVRPPATLQDVIDAARANPDGAVMFSIKWGSNAHTLLAKYHPLQGVMLADRSGRIVRSFAELSSFYGRAVKDAVPFGTMAVVEAARLVKALNVSSLLSQLALEVVAVLTPGAKQALSSSAQPSPKPIAGDRKTIGTHTVAAGDWLSKLAIRYYKDMLLWPLIYDYNVNLIGPDYNRLMPGTVLQIPDPSSYSAADLTQARDRARHWAPSSVRSATVGRPG